MQTVADVNPDTTKILIMPSKGAGGAGHSPSRVHAVRAMAPAKLASAACRTSAVRVAIARHCSMMGSYAALQYYFKLWIATAAVSAIICAGSRTYRPGLRS